MSKIIQEHHITYEPEYVVYVFKGEHGALTKIQWWCRGEVSKGFLEALSVFISEHRNKAVELEERYHEQERRKKAKRSKNKGKKKSKNAQNNEGITR